eukprot:2234204-Pleurochrysis_carterae.AAC.1
MRCFTEEYALLTATGQNLLYISAASSHPFFQVAVAERLPVALRLLPARTLRRLHSSHSSLDLLEQQTQQNALHAR